MNPKKDKPIRADPDLVDDIRKAAGNRFKKGVDSEVRRDREITEMMRNCPSFPDVMDELSTIPRKEDIGKLK